MTKIAIASDHAGFHLKEILKKHLTEKGHEVEDFGTDSDESVDYPDFIFPAAQSVAAGKNDAGLVLGGSGNGEAMAANKVGRIRCALCWNKESVKLAKKHNNANMISLGARMIDQQTALAIVDTWLSAKFEGGRHITRIEKLHAFGR